MAVYNGEKYLAEAIDSILKQTYRPIEIIIVDDGSTDRTRQIATGYGDRIQYIHKPHTGLSDTRNRCIAASSGAYIAFLDADDLWVKNKLSLQVAAAIEENADIVFCHVRQFISPEMNREEKARIHCPEAPVPGYLGGASLIRRDIFEKTGEFSSDYQLGEFIEWYLRAKAMHLKIIMLPDVLLERRLHKSNMTSKHASSRLDFVRLVKANLDRQRQNRKTNS